MADILDTAKGVLGTVAPLLARAVGGPLAGQAAQFICGALGLSSDTPPDQMAAAIQNATPEQLAALKKADNDFKVAMRQLEVQESQLAYGDIADARAREIAVRDHVPAMIAVGVVAGFFGLLGLMAFRDVPAANATALNLMIGTLGASVGAVLQYYFGSSRGSQEKDKMLWQSAPK